MGSVDIAILGDGIIGLSCAYKLASADPSLRVALVGQPRRNLSASRAAGAMLGCFGEVVRGTLKSEAGRARLDLAVQAGDLWPSWLDELLGAGSTDIKVAEDTFVFLNTVSGEIDEANLAAIRSAMVAYGRKFDEPDPADVPGLSPVTHARSTRALRIEGEGAVDGSRLISHLEQQCERLGVARVAEDVSRIQGHAPPYEIFGATEVVLTAETVVIAAGVKSWELLASWPEVQARTPRLFAGVGCALVVNQPHTRIESVLRSPNRSFACGIHVLPRSDDAVYVGATNNIMPTPKGRPMLSDLDLLIESCVDQVNYGLQGSELRDLVVGNRPVSADCHPLIGELSVKGVYLISGTYREGFHLSPLLADDLASRILTGTSILPTSLFLPERPLIQTYTREEAIQEALDHYMALSFERQLRPPRAGGWLESLEAMIRQKIEAIYDEVGTEFVLPPDFVWDVDTLDCVTEFGDYYRSIESAHSA